MKKNRFGVMILALVMALALMLPALGEAAAPEKLAEFQAGTFLGNTSLVAFSKERGGPEGIMGPDGKEILPNEYLYLKQNNIYGYIEAAKEQGMNTSGLIDQNGEVLIPLEYGIFEILSQDWVIAIKLEEGTADNADYKGFWGGYYRVVDRHFYYMPEKKEVGVIARDKFEKVTAYPGFLIIKDTEGVNTVYDESFVAVGTAEETYLGFTFDKMDVKRVGDGKVVFTFPYEVSNYNAGDHSFRLVKDNLAGRGDTKGQVVVEPAYAQLLGTYGGYTSVKETNDGKLGLIGPDGKAVTPFEYDEVLMVIPRGVSNTEGSQYFVDGYAGVVIDGKVGFVNDKGEMTVPATYAKDAVKVWGNTLTYTDVSGKTMIVAADGKVTELNYKKVEPFYYTMNGRLFLVTDDKDQIGVVDWHGDVVIAPANYAGYDNYSSADGKTLLMKNKDSGKVEMYKVN